MPVQPAGVAGARRWGFDSELVAAGSLAELPGRAFGGVGDLDAELIQLVADLVGAGPVTFLAGLGAVRDELLDGVPLLRGQRVSGPAM